MTPMECPTTMPHAIFPLLLSLTLVTAAQATEPAPAPAETPPAAASPPASSASATPAPATPAAPRVIFRPTETISEDTAVPFPADI